MAATARSTRARRRQRTASVGSSVHGPLTITASEVEGEGAEYALTLPQHDLSSNTIQSWTIFWGDGTFTSINSTTQTQAQMLTQTHTFANGSYTITAVAASSAGNFSASTTLTVDLANAVAQGLTVATRLRTTAVTTRSTAAARGRGDFGQLQRSGGFGVAYRDDPMGRRQRPGKPPTRPGRDHFRLSGPPVCEDRHVHHQRLGGRCRRIYLTIHGRCELQQRRSVGPRPEFGSSRRSTPATR